MSSLKDIIEALNKEVERERIEDREHLFTSVIRAFDALKLETTPQSIDVERLNRDTLVALAKKTHDNFIHFSGNCTLLSGAFLFNLKAGKTLLRVGNVYPIFTGLHPLAVNKLLLSGKGCYQTFDTVTGIKELEQKLLDTYHQTKQKFYRINTNDHQWNAVILIENDKPVMQFVDPWKTSNPVPTTKEFAKSYEADQEFIIESTHGTINFPEIVRNIQKQGEIKVNFDLDTFKRAYLLKYKHSFFKNPLSSMKMKLERITTVDEVLEHAAKNPKSRTIDVLKSIGAISPDASPFTIK